MRPDFLRVLLLSSACVLSACPSSPSPSGPDTGTPPPVDAGTGSSGEVAPSSRDNLRFMNPEQLTAHFASALSLPPEQVCNELGQYPCATYAHTVVLGGVEPYRVGLYEPLKVTGATTPNVIDRMALAACARRVSLDVTHPEEAVLFKGLELDAQGRLANRDGAPVRDVITSLYQRVLLRDPTETEVGALSQLATRIESTGSQTPGRDWMTAACFSVLSSAESVFF
ncbi:hypothetical protein [Archangium lipolyticum]|uniref:hypothetical protein n=1 Tax=Archangium lipolyticum TaxID=2970465 RepID=UPI00214A3BAA|nr:hypothetical protein [Archangium lipolyticum]